MWGGVCMCRGQPVGGQLVGGGSACVDSSQIPGKTLQNLNPRIFRSMDGRTASMLELEAFSCKSLHSVGLVSAQIRAAKSNHHQMAPALRASTFCVCSRSLCGCDFAPVGTWGTAGRATQADPCSTPARWDCSRCTTGCATTGVNKVSSAHQAVKK